MLKTLQRQGNSLAASAEQLRVLGDPQRVPEGHFAERIATTQHAPLLARSLDTLQINLGRVCNQTCTHCHVDAGPDRREAMSRETAEEVIAFLKRVPSIRTLDITGGAPEMNPHFAWLVEQAAELGRQVIDRCNLTILLAPGFTHLPELLARYRVTVIASLPCYLEQNCDAQRGDGVFEKSIRAIRELNRRGYADPATGPELNLVYNPVGSGLPPDQAELEDRYRLELANRFGIRFNRLFTITNMPISRFLDDLLRRGEYQAYMEKLITAFNPSTLDSLMCRSLVSVDWQGFLYDCDFNQMLGLPLGDGEPLALSQATEAELIGRRIRTANHCYGCTAGCGSGCQGSLTDDSPTDQRGRR
jgi:radical SAM/Cys-rich protein